MKPSLKRTIQAQLRDARVLFQESWRSLVLFVSIVTGGALIFHFFYIYPGTNQNPNFAEALHATFSLVFFETNLPFPEQWYLQILFFVVPILGLIVAADGVIRFGVALINKQARGQKWQVAMASTYSKHVIVCGLGKVGYRVILELLKFEREAVAVEIDPDGRFVEKAESLSVPVIIADARRSENLVKAGVKRAAAIIPCTFDELANLDIALDARELNPDIKVVMRMFDTDLARRIEKGFGIRTTFSISALAAPIFAAAAMKVNVKSSFYVGDTLLNISEIAIEPGSQITGWSVEQLEKEFDLSVVCHQEGETTSLHPDSSDCLNAGVKLLVVGSLKTLHRLSEINRPAPER